MIHTLRGTCIPMYNRRYNHLSNLSQIMYVVLLGDGDHHYFKNLDHTVKRHKVFQKVKLNMSRVI